MNIDISKIKFAAMIAMIYWPSGMKIKTGRWSAIDNYINTLQPKSALAMCEEIERLREKIKQLENSKK